MANVPIAVLVVDDEPLILMSTSQLLEDEGFEVYHAENADVAIALLSRHAQIQLLFTDIDMPGSMDGLKLAAAVRERWPPVRIIVTSGARTVEITDMPDGTVFFSKPYSHVAVIQSIRELLSV